MRVFFIVIALLLFAPQVRAGQMIDINCAEVGTLVQGLQGIDAAKAQAIVTYRQVHGAFRSVEQLALVKGIDLATAERNRKQIVFGQGTAQACPLQGSALPRDGKLALHVASLGREAIAPARR